MNCKCERKNISVRPNQTNINLVNPSYVAASFLVRGVLGKSLTRVSRCFSKRQSETAEPLKIPNPTNAEMPVPFVLTQ